MARAKTETLAPTTAQPAGSFAALVPAMLLGVRITLGPVLLIGALYRWPGVWLTIVIAVGFCSDVFDGIIARKLGVATEHLRVADSWADAAFYGCAAIAIWTVRHALVVSMALPLLACIAAMGVSAGADLIKYRRVTSYHTYAAKLWGVTLLFAVVAILGFNGGPTSLLPVIVVCIYSSAEGLAMTLILPNWTHDVPHLFKAIEIRKSMRKES
jgi:CDP-diacylglycerol--glycerol-3-phosphate 3-phosphatidyltransferase